MSNTWCACPDGVNVTFIDQQDEGIDRDGEHSPRTKVKCLTQGVTPG